MPASVPCSLPGLFGTLAAMLTETSKASHPLVVPLAPAAQPISAEQQAKNLRFATRIWCVFLTVLSGAMLGIGRFYLTPDPHGLGTHMQLHLPPCGFYQITGLPCPTCGCTTAVTYLAHGNFLSAILTQPFGAAVGFVALILLVLGPVGVVTGKWLGPEPFTMSFYWQRLVYGSLGLLLVAWIYKMVMVHYHLAV